MGGPAGEVALLVANRSLKGFLASGTRRLKFDAVEVEIAMGANDTVDSVLRRLHDEKQIDATLDLLRQAMRGHTDMLAAGGAFLLPPAPTVITGVVTPKLPPAPTTLPYFPVQVTMLTTRGRQRVSPDVAGRGSRVELVDSHVGPAGFTGPAGAGSR